MSEQASVKTRMGAYAIVPLWLVLHPDVKDFALRVFVYLVARHADREDATCFPKRRTIAEALGVAECTLDRAFGQLKKAGALTIDNRHDESGNLISSLYTVIFDHPGGGLGAKMSLGGVGAKMSLPRRKNDSSILVRTNNQLTGSRQKSPGLQVKGRTCPHEDRCRTFTECTERILREGRQVTH